MATNERRVVLLVYDGFELLDMSGPASVFATANRVARTALYSVHVCSNEGGETLSAAGVQVGSVRAASIPVGGNDTLLAVGATPARIARLVDDGRLVSWMRTAAPRAARYGSVCTGAFVLAAAGLLAGRRVTTHWDACTRLAALEPTADVDLDAVFVRDGSLWTSAGVTTGIDMALAMVRADHGVALMSKVAGRLVMATCRSGEHTQRSALLEAQSRVDDELRDVLGWIEAHLGDPITVGDMAERAGLSERTFHRRFKRLLGVTPAKYLERVRIAVAQQLLRDGVRVKSVARTVGFRSESGFRAAFETGTGALPSCVQAQACPALGTETAESDSPAMDIAARPPPT